MRVPGIDPGLTWRGMGMVNARGARRVNLVDMKVIRSSAELASHKRLLIVANGPRKVIDAFKPDTAAAEGVLVRSNIRSATNITQVTGIVIFATARAELHLAMYTPSGIKAAVTGNECASKHQVQVMIQRIFGLASLPRPADAVDAVVITIAYSRHGSALPDEGPDRAQHDGAGTLPRTIGDDLIPAQRM